MKNLALALALIGLSSVALETRPALAQQITQPVAQPVEAQFSFTVDAPLDRALALFGPVEETHWSPSFAPRFLALQGPADDPDFAVFETGEQSAPMTWVMAQHDRGSHVIEYVVLHGQAVAMTITIQCERLAAKSTRAIVSYRRVALASEGGPPAEEFRAHIQSQGPQWQQAINSYLHDADH